MKRILTRYVLGGFFALLSFVLLVVLAFNYIGEHAFPFQKTDEEMALEKSMSVYLKNHYFFSESSVMKPIAGIDLHYRPELKKALESGATSMITRKDHNSAMDAMFEEKNVYGVIDKALKKGLYSIIFSFVLAALLCFGWIKLYDPVIRAFNQFRKGRLYDGLAVESAQKDEIISRQKAEIASLKTRFNEIKRAYETLEQKFRTFYNQVKEKEQSEAEAAEKMKSEAEEKKAAKEEAKRKAAALD